MMVDGGLIEMVAHPLRIGHDFLARRRRDGTFRGLLDFRGHGVVGGLPCHQPAIQNRSAVTEAE